MSMMVSGMGPKRREIAARAVALLDADPTRVWPSDELRRALGIKPGPWPAIAAYIGQTRREDVRHICDGPDRRTFQSRKAPSARVISTSEPRDVSAKLRAVVERLQADPREHRTSALKAVAGATAAEWEQIAAALRRMRQVSVGGARLPTYRWAP